jgi:hypothetical protein
MYTYGNLDSYNLGYSAGSNVWTIIALVLAIIGAILAYFMFVKPDKNYPQKFVNWLRSFLNFNEMLIEPILKITYIFVTVYVVLTSFSLISYSFLSFLEYLVLGVLMVRVSYEAIMILISIWKNTKEINKKMK